MTIAEAFNDIAVAQGGAASKSGTIAGAIDALNDALAGSDQPAAQTIEGAIKLLGEHIGSGGGGATVKAYIMPEVSYDFETGSYDLYDATCVTMAVGEANCSRDNDNSGIFKLRIVAGAELDFWGIPVSPNDYEQVAYTSNDDGTYTFTVPALGDGDALYIIWFYADHDPFSE